MSCAKSCKDLPHLEKFKYIVNTDTVFAHFVSEFRKAIKLMPAQALFYYVDDGTVMVHVSNTMGALHTSYGNEDGFLYFIYASENTFGHP